MIRGLYTSSAGMQVESLRQEAIANNLANLNTHGFKKDMAVAMARENKRLMRTNNPASADPLAVTKRVPIGELGTGVWMDRIVKRFEQGDLQQTENPYDLALSGEGFFTLEDGNGRTFYTRAGDFTRDSAGRLVDKQGRTLQGLSGAITLPIGKLAVSSDGLVSVDGRVVDRLALAQFADPDNELEKVGDTLFAAHAGAEPTVSRATVQQGQLETANVNSVREMVEMISALRQYEANQKAVQSQDETLAKAVNDVGRA